MKSHNNSLNCNNSRNYFNSRNKLVNLNTITKRLYLIFKTRLLPSRIHARLTNITPPATARSHHPSGVSLPRRQCEVARRPRTTVFDLLRVHYIIPVPIAISEVYTLIRTIATLIQISPISPFWLYPLNRYVQCAK